MRCQAGVDALISMLNWYPAWSGPPPHQHLLRIYLLFYQQHLVS